MEATREQFLEQRHRQFGTANPQQMDMPFWESMVRSGKHAYGARKQFGALDDEGAVWCFKRFGMSQTILSDGRTLCVAGEHEDYYDPDFCIYNDLIVKYPDGAIQIFGYPREVFPPTDFHTATLVDKRLILIGSLGYQHERRVGHTPVYELSLPDFHLSPIETTGEMPGWISRHEAELGPDGRIVIRGGDVMRLRDGKQLFRRNVEEFSFDPSGQWVRLTHRNWREFSIGPDPSGMLPYRLRQCSSTVDEFLPTEVPHQVLEADEWNQRLLTVEGVRVAITLNSFDLRVLIEGMLSDNLISRLLEDIRKRVEAFSGGSCALEEV